MSEIKALEKLRDYQLYDKTEEYTAFVQLGSVLADEIQAEIDERFMELPCDCDGVPIHIGDKLLKSTGAPKESYGEVVGISDDSVWFNEKQGWSANWSKLTRHVKPRTLFDILADVEDGMLAINTAEAEIRELLGVDE